MDNTPQPLNKTELTDRTLWFDGDSTVDDADVIRLISLGLPVDGIFVKQLTADIRQYNKFVSDEHKITVKESVSPLSYEWNIPDEYKNLDLREYILDRLNREIELHPEWDEQAISNRAVRFAKEMKLYTKQKLTDILRALIYIINTLEANQVVWGVGRGSSVSSYVLYLIGVHDVDSVEYELDISDFIRNE